MAHDTLLSSQASQLILLTTSLTPFLSADPVKMVFNRRLVENTVLHEYFVHSSKVETVSDLNPSDYRNKRCHLPDWKRNFLISLIYSFEMFCKTLSVFTILCQTLAYLVRQSDIFCILWSILLTLKTFGTVLVHNYYRAGNVHALLVKISWSSGRTSKI